MTEDRNARIRERLDAAKARSGDLARSGTETVRGLVEEHPVAALAGGILLGALIARMLPRAPVKTAGSRASALAALGAEIAVAYAAKAAEKGRESVHKLEDIGGAVGEKLSDGTSEAKKRAVDFADIAAGALREAGEIAVKRANEFASRVKR
ncbi:hypothetical protein OLX02_03105 [Novosphingobium sp. KCTC 2891]|uniref:hypothetical protein n=1 Tax=Novosphingobium sp. KCTC 2891 TaxID=2989730 RepID=UPI00222196CC|nr:hypothetical protein [Novosphingobium sp. KCTC 2891]MCW1381805.1 hypothetical protein [Novosphingobium sp. KCTC 2891]